LRINFSLLSLRRTHPPRPSPTHLAGTLTAAAGAGIGGDHIACAPPMATHASKSYLCAGSSSFDDPDVVEVSPAAAAAGGWASGHNKRKRSQVVPHEVIEIDDDDPDGVMIVGDKTSVDKNKQTVVYPMDWAKHGKSSLVHEIPGPSTYASKYANPWVDLKMFQDDAVYNYSDDYPYEGFDEDYAYDEDEYEDDGYDASLVESEYNYSLSSKFDNLDIPPGVEPSLPWMQKTEIANKSKPTKIVDAKIEEKYKVFKQFDTVDDHSDHYYSKPELRKVQVVKKVRFFTCPLYPSFP
jgi:ubiquitin-conjugating enzyme E2 O